MLEGSWWICKRWPILWRIGSRQRLLGVQGTELWLTEQQGWLANRMRHLSKLLQTNQIESRQENLLFQEHPKR